MEKGRPITVAFKARSELKRWLETEAQSQFRTLSAEVAMKLEKLMEEAQKEKRPNGGNR